MQTQTQRHDDYYLNPANHLPHCNVCKKPIKMLRRKGGLPPLKVQLKPIQYLPQDYGDTITVIDAATKKERKGVLVRDGIRGWLPHRCARMHG